MNASRAVDSQQMLVAVPAMMTVSIPAACSRSSRSLEPWINALKRRLMTCWSPGCTSSACHSMAPSSPSVSAPSMSPRNSGDRNSMYADQVRGRIVAIRRVGGHPLLDPDVLHVDDDQGRLRRIQPVERMQLAAAPFGDAGDDVGGKLDLVRLGHFIVLCQRTERRTSRRVMSE